MYHDRSQAFGLARFDDWSVCGKEFTPAYASQLVTSVECDINVKARYCIRLLPSPLLRLRPERHHLVSSCQQFARLKLD